MCDYLYKQLLLLFNTKLKGRKPGVCSVTKQLASAFQASRSLSTVLKGVLAWMLKSLDECSTETWKLNTPLTFLRPDLRSTVIYIPQRGMTLPAAPIGNGWTSGQNANGFLKFLIRRNWWEFLILHSSEPHLMILLKWFGGRFKTVAGPHLAHRT